MSKPSIGFIGLGIMGNPMSKHLLAAGYDVVVHNRSREPVAELVDAGAREAHSPREVAEQSTVVITMLPDSPDVEEVALGPGGIIEGVSRNDIYIDMSTIAPTVTQDVGRAMAQPRRSLPGCAGKRRRCRRAECHPFHHGGRRRGCIRLGRTHFRGNGAEYRAVRTPRRRTDR